MQSTFGRLVLLFRCRLKSNSEAPASETICSEAGASELLVLLFCYFQTKLLENQTT